MRFTYFLAVSLLLVCGSVLVSKSLACDDRKDCSSCLNQNLFKTAADNAKRIQGFLSSKKCTDWRNLKFRAMAISSKGHTSCRTFDGLPYVSNETPQCNVAELLDLSIDEEISNAATTSVIDNLARDGQLECEPNGAMVFNRGRARFLELDSLYEPTLYIPLVYGINARETVGFEVILSNELSQSSNSVPKHWCNKISSAFFIFYDVVDGTGRSILPASA